jgi:hypothetical protein
MQGSGKNIVKNKFNARKTEFKGVIYDSKKEASVAAILHSNLENGIVLGVERQILFKFPLNCKRQPKMIVDFKVTNKDGSVKYWEVKGGRATMTPVYKLKKKMLEHFFGIDLKEV